MFDDITQEIEKSRDDNIRQVEMAIKNIDSDEQVNAEYIYPGFLGPLSETDEEVKEWLRTVWFFELGFSFTAQMPKDF